MTQVLRDVLVLRGLLTEPGRELVDWQPWVQPGRAGAEIRTLYSNDGATAFLVRFGPDAHGDLHEHLGFETMLVLDGELVNDNGDVYGVGDLVVEEPASVHQVSSPGGCTLFVTRQRPTRPVY